MLFLEFINQRFQFNLFAGYLRFLLNWQATSQLSEGHLLDITAKGICQIFSQSLAIRFICSVRIRFGPDSAEQSIEGGIVSLDNRAAQFIQLQQAVVYVPNVLVEDTQQLINFTLYCVCTRFHKNLFDQSGVSGCPGIRLPGCGDQVIRISGLSE